MGLFGPTKKGGSFDMRFKSNRGGMLGKVSRGVSSGLGSMLNDGIDDNGGADDDKFAMQIHAENEAKERELREKKDAIKMFIADTVFNSEDPKDTSLKLDNLISQARIGLGLGMPLFLFSAKIRTGLAKLKQVGAYELSDHYEREFKLLNRVAYLRLGIKVFAAIAIVIFLWWFLFLM
jgi:hypothetical protein